MAIFKALAITRAAYNLRNQYLVNTRYFTKFMNPRRLYTTDKLNRDSENIVSSNMPDVKNFKNIHLHDFIWENMNKWSDHTALVCSVTGKSYKYGELREMCSRLATNLRRNNLLPGDTIAIILPNIPEYAIISLAANEAGLCTMLMNPAFTVYEMKTQLKNSNVNAIFTFPAKYADVRACIEKDLKLKLPVVIVNNNIDTYMIMGTIPFPNLIRRNIEEFSANYKTNVKDEDTVFLPYSSGTTGLPKGVEITHRNVVANILQREYVDIRLSRDTTADHQEVLPLILPMYHAYGLLISLYHGLRHGYKMVCVPQISSNKLVQVIENYRPTILHLVPPLVQMILYNEQIKQNHLDALAFMLTGGAPLGENLIGKFQDRFGNSTNFIQGYGMTEATCTISFSANTPPASSGYIVSNTQMKIVGHEDNNMDRNLGPREVGQIYVRGPQIMKGYYNNPKATADMMDGDWMRTGDLGYYTEDGLLYISGRLKELIKVKGLQVSPVELEDVIHEYDKVQDVGVIGVKHEKYGEIPKAFVVLKSGVKFNVEELKEFVAKRVAKFKQLGYVEVVTEIPKTPSGKILRKELHKL